MNIKNMQKLAREFPGKVVVLAVSVDGEETRGAARSFLTQRGFDFALLFDNEKNRDLQIVGVPTRFLIDRNGRVRVRELGSSPYRDLVFERRLQSLLNTRNRKGPIP